MACGCKKKVVVDKNCGRIPSDSISRGSGLVRDANPPAITLPPPVVVPPEPPPVCPQQGPIVKISPANGSYVQFPTIILMSAGQNATIHYTLDGTEPTLYSPTYFFGLVLPNANYTVTARAFPNDGCPPGPIATASYNDLEEPSDFDFRYLCPTGDHAGSFPNPPLFAANGQANDLQWLMAFTLGLLTEIIRIECYQVDGFGNWLTGQVWATDEYIHPYDDQSIPFHCYPLVIKSEPGAVQLFADYQSTLGSYAAATYEWRLWGQPELPVEGFFKFKLFLGDGKIIERIITTDCTPPPPPCEKPDHPSLTASCTPDVLVEGTTPNINQIFNIWRRGIITEDCPDTLPQWIPVHTGISDGSGDYSWTDAGVMNCCMYEYYVEVLCSPSQGFKASDTAGPVTIPCEGEVDIDADKTTTCAGDEVTLTWTSEHCDSVSIDNGIGVVGPDGSVVVNPAVTTTYTITCNNADCGNVTAMVTITVISGSGCDCFVHTADPIAVPDSVTVTWVNTSGIEQSAVCPNTGYKYPVGHPFAGLYAISTINYVNASNTVSVQPNLCAFVEADCPDASWGALMTAGNPNNIVIWKGCLSSSLSPIGTYELVRSFGNVPYTIEVS